LFLKKQKISALWKKGKIKPLKIFFKYFTNAQFTPNRIDICVTYPNIIK